MRPDTHSGRVTIDAVTTIGIVSPGAMGSALGRVWQAGGARVITTVAGRSPRTRRLAGGLHLLPDLAAVVEAADLVVSVGPPEQAVSMARTIADACRRSGVRPLVADVNAIAPSTVALVAAELARSGCELIDGSISGGPPKPADTSSDTDHPTAGTTLYLSGPSARRLDELAAPGLATVVVGESVGTASAVKMCTASVYKGFSGLVLQALRTAQVNGVLDVVLADLGPHFAQIADAAPMIASAAAKSDRFPGEMREIARTQADAGAVGALFEGFASVFEAVHASPLAAHPPEDAAGRTDLTGVLRELEP